MRLADAEAVSQASPLFADAVIGWPWAAAIQQEMTENRRPGYEPDSPLWWGIDPDGHPNAAKLRAIVESTIAIAHPERIILFGSAARGDMNEDSDIDLLVVADTLDRRATARRIRRSRPQRSAPLDVIVATVAEVEANRRDACCFIHDALREGRVLYDADAD